MGALRAEKIRFQVIGMTAANIQGVPGSTIGVDLWIDLAPRDYMRAMNVAVQQGAEMIRNTVAVLEDQTLVNFVFEVTGLPAFGRTIGKAKKLRWGGVLVDVLPLDLIAKSKRAVGRPKDLLHLELIRQAQAVGRKNK